MSSNHKTRLRRILEETLKVAIGLGLLGMLWHQGLIDPRVIGRSIQNHPVGMALAILVQGAMFLMLATRWKVVALPSKISIPLELSTRLTLTSQFFSTCLPGNGAGDLVKGWIFSKTGTDFGIVLGTMVLDRVVGMTGLFLSWSVFLILAIATHPSSTGLLVPFLVVAVLTTASLLVLLAFSRKIDRWLEHRPLPEGVRARKVYQFVGQTVKPVSRGATAPKAIALALGFSLAIQFSYVLTVWLSGQILSTPIGIVAAGAVLPLVSLVNAIPISPGGVGIGETVGATAMHEFGLQQNAGAQVVLVARFASIFWSVVGALCYLTLRANRIVPSSAIEGRQKLS